MSVSRITAKITKLTAALEAAQAELLIAQEAAALRPQAAPAAPLPAVGEVIDFTYGRKEPRTLTGVVIAVQEAAGRGAPPAVRVRTGEGFEEQTLSIHPNQIQRPASEAEAAAE